MSYIWENESWPNFVYDELLVSKALERLRKDKYEADIAYSLIDDRVRMHLMAENVSEEIVSSLNIEGESIDINSVYSSVAKHLSITFAGKSKDSAYSKSITQMVWDALENHGPLTHQRLVDWNTRLFENIPGRRPKTIGSYRVGPEYVMKYSGKSSEIIYEAVGAERVYEEMDAFISFVNGEDEVDPFVKAAISSLWFVMIHPFEDGNGRISRAVADYIIASGCNSPFHAFNISAGILKNRKDYYEQIRLASCDNPGMNITNWVIWFLGIVADCIVESKDSLRRTLRSSAFMKRLDPNVFNSREMSMLYRLADGSFYGKLTTEKWMKMTKCSKAAAFRDIQHLVQKGYLLSSNDSGRNQGYFFNPKVMEEDVGGR